MWLEIIKDIVVAAVILLGIFGIGSLIIRSTIQYLDGRRDMEEVIISNDNDINRLWQRYHSTGDRHWKRKRRFGTSKNFRLNPSKRFVGVEIETDADDKTNLFRKSTKEVKKGKKVKEISELNKIFSDFSSVYDASISGQEFVSNPLNGDLLFNRIKKVCETLKSLNYYNSKSSGLHIHLDMTKHCRNVEMLKKVAIFYYKFELYLLLMMPKGRWKNSYCKRMKKTSLKTIQNIKSLSDFRMFVYGNSYCESGRYKKERYNGINFNSILYRKTLEVRYHEGTLKYEDIIGWITLHNKILDFCEKKSAQQILNYNNNAQNFVKIFLKPTQKYVMNRLERFKKDNIKEFTKFRLKNLVRCKSVQNPLHIKQK